jgi:hypothetical protein
LHENAKAIEAWRATLPERQRRRLVHPLSNVRRWQASLNHGNGKCPTDLKRDAVAVASFRFVRGIVAARSGAAAMASRPGASGGGISSWLRQAKVKSITRAAMPVLIAARHWKTTKHIAGISFRHCRPRVI